MAGGRRGLAGLRHPVGGLQAAQRAAHPRSLPATACRRSTTTSRARPRSWSRASWPGCAALGTALADARVVLVGAGAAGIGIARLLRLAMLEDGHATRRRPRGDRAGRLARAGPRRRGPTSTPTKRELALPADAAYAGDRLPDAEFPDLVETIARRPRPTVLVGTTGVAGTFDEAVIRAMAAGDRRGRSSCRSRTRPRSPRRPRPTSCAGPTAGPSSRPARRSTPVEVDGRRHEIGQANNVFIFPGLGLGAIVAEARTITDRMFLLAARTLAEP